PPRALALRGPLHRDRRPPAPPHLTRASPHPRRLTTAPFTADTAEKRRARRGNESNQSRRCDSAAESVFPSCTARAALSFPLLLSASSATLCVLCGDPLRAQLAPDRARISCTARCAWSMAASV